MYEIFKTMVEFVCKSALVAFLAVCLLSCRSSTSQPSTSSKEPSSSSVDTEPIYPPENTELKSDTSFLLGEHAYEVFSNHFTIPEQFVSKVVEYEDGNDTLVFRDWAVEVVIKKDDQYQVRDTFDKNDFYAYPNDSIFLQSSIIQSFWLADAQKRPIFYVVIGIPETDDVILNGVSFDDSGKLMVSEIEEGDRD